MPYRLTAQERLYRAVPESQVVQDVINYLSIRGCLAWRNNTGGGRFQNKGSNTVRYVQFSAPGAADVFAVYRGYFLAFECKTELGTVSEEQHAWRQLLETVDGIWRRCKPSDYIDVIDHALALCDASNARIDDALRAVGVLQAEEG